MNTILNSQEFLTYKAKQEEKSESIVCWHDIILNTANETKLFEETIRDYSISVIIFHHHTNILSSER